MKSPFYALAVLALALGASSCANNTELTPGAGYSARDSYYRGFNDGRLDRARGLTHNPHINDPDTLPSAYRKEYLWGYCEGYEGRTTRYSSK